MYSTVLYSLGLSVHKNEHKYVVQTHSVLDLEIYLQNIL